MSFQAPTAVSGKPFLSAVTPAVPPHQIASLFKSCSSSSHGASKYHWSKRNSAGQSCKCIYLHTQKAVPCWVALATDQTLLSPKPYKSNKPWSPRGSRVWRNSWNGLTPNKVPRLSMALQTFLVRCSSSMKLVSSYRSSYSLDSLHLGFSRKSPPASPDDQLIFPFVLVPSLFIRNSYIPSAKHPLAGRKMGIWVGKLGKNNLNFTFLMIPALRSLEDRYFSKERRVLPAAGKSTLHWWDPTLFFLFLKQALKSWSLGNKK